MGSGGAPQHFQGGTGEFIQFRVQLFTFEHGVETLDGGDADLGYWIDAAGLKVLNVIKLSEDAAVVRGAEGLELLESLAAEVAAVHQEQHAAGTGELDEPVESIAGCVSLARSGSHLDQGSTAAVAEGVFQGINRGELRLPEAKANDRRHGGEACFEIGARAGEFIGKPFRQGLRPVKAEDKATGGAGLRSE